MGEDASDGFVDFGEPDGFGNKLVLDGEVETSVSRELGRCRHKLNNDPTRSRRPVVESCIRGSG